MSTVELLRTILEVVAVRSPKYKMDLPSGKPIDLVPYGGQVLSALDQSRPLKRDKVSPQSSLFKQTVTVKTASDYKKGSFLSKAGATLEDRIGLAALTNACTMGLDLEKTEFVGGTMCDAFEAVSDYSDHPLNLYRRWANHEKNTIVAVCPEPVFYGLSRAPKQSTGMSPTVRIVTTGCLADITRLENRAKREHFFRARYHETSLRDLMDCPTVITLKELRYRLKYGQKSMPVYTYSWYETYSKKRLSGFRALRDAFTDHLRRESFLQGSWDADCEHLYQRIMTTLEVCRCMESAPGEEEFSFSGNPGFTQKRLAACGEFAHWDCADPSCRLFRDCPMGVRTMNYPN